MHIPNNKRKKLDKKSIKCILLGTSEESKAYRMYDPVSKKVLVSRDVVFVESEGWNWDKNEEAPCGGLLDMEDESETESEYDESAAETEDNHEAETGNENSVEENTLNGEATDEYEDHLGKRISKPPTWHKDYITRAETKEMHSLAAIAHIVDPETYEESVKHTKWIKAMETELEAIERNGPGNWLILQGVLRLLE